MKPTFPTVSYAQITQEFGNYAPQYYGGDGTHQGIDYGVPVGTPVYACMDGNVITATSQQTGYGRHVRIQHPDGTLSIYGHLSKLQVLPGERVTSGQCIGYSGGDPNDSIDGDGNSTGAHLHWEIRNASGNAINPEKHCLDQIEANHKKASVTAPLGLFVRSSPATTAPSVRMLEDKSTVEVIEVINGWARLMALRPEWCYNDYLKYEEIGVSDTEMLARLWAAHPELHT